MPEESGTSPNTKQSGRNDRSRRTNNNYYEFNTERPQNTVSGFENLTLITRSRTPALDLKKVKEALQNKVKREEKDGFEAAALLDGLQTQTAPSSGVLSQSVRPTRPAHPTMPDHASDDYKINRTFNVILHKAAVSAALLRYKNESVAFETDEKVWGSTVLTTSGTLKRTKNNAHKMVGTLMELQRPVRPHRRKGLRSG